jgi:hypothetical protein
LTRKLNRRQLDFLRGEEGKYDPKPFFSRIRVCILFLVARKSVKETAAASTCSIPPKDLKLFPKKKNQLNHAYNNGYSETRSKISDLSKLTEEVLLLLLTGQAELGRRLEAEEAARTSDVQQIRDNFEKHSVDLNQR